MKNKVSVASKRLGCFRDSHATERAEDPPQVCAAAPPHGMAEVVERREREAPLKRVFPQKLKEEGVKLGEPHGSRGF